MKQIQEDEWSWIRADGIFWSFASSAARRLQQAFRHCQRHQPALHSINNLGKEKEQ
jgi:hypothetical protein